MKWREVRFEIRKCGNDSYRLLLVGVFLFCGDGLCDGEYMQKKFTVIVHIRINTFLYHFVRVYAAARSIYNDSFIDDAVIFLSFNDNKLAPPAKYFG